eukprot:Blabericola_migrator_1__2659@NODE_1754_length_3853_cov_6_641310_g1131_i0_p2_GENE_NODE_1754_length_3853_cov_6_641310_g1131_i0NODE_1754_length_3853_cov_6_641310_g1131_i0_p2_ORF_typecomplete_len311_score64_00Integrin_beta/PF00362_18/9_6e12VWA/PF00092_28/0_00034_NODE_1754_length_3853_cov_6_641310_g1131_i010011933
MHPTGPLILVLAASLAQVGGDTTTGSTSAGDCTVTRAVELFLLQDVTGSFTHALPETLAALPGFVEPLMTKYPGMKVGMGGFGDKNTRAVPGYDLGLECWTPGTPLTTDMSAFTAGINAMNVSCCNGGDTPEDPLEAACWVAGSYGGFTPYSGSTSDPVMRVIVVITDAKAHYGDDGDKEISDIETNWDCDLENYAPKSQLQSCLHNHGINLIVVAHELAYDWWKEELPKWGYDDTNSALSTLSLGDGTDVDAQAFMDTTFKAITDTLGTVTCAVEENQPPPVTTVTTQTTVTETTETVPDECCAICQTI